MQCFMYYGVYSSTYAAVLTLRLGVENDRGGRSSQRLST